MDRVDAYSIISSELDWLDKKFPNFKNEKCKTYMYIKFAKHHIDHALEMLCMQDEKASLDNLRTATALLTQCIMNSNVGPRDQEDKE